VFDIRLTRFDGQEILTGTAVPREGVTELTLAVSLVEELFTAPRPICFICEPDTLFVLTFVSEGVSYKLEGSRNAAARH
jgi:hypothetical protein